MKSVALTARAKNDVMGTGVFSATYPIDIPRRRSPSGKSYTSYSPSSDEGSLPRLRLFDAEGFIRRAACVCVNPQETQILLISSKKNPAVWLVPGGGVEEGEEEAAAAKREAWEEAGVRGRVLRHLGLLETRMKVKKHRTSVFVVRVTQQHDDFPEANLGRQRRWFCPEEALVKLKQHKPLHCHYLQMYLSKLNS